MAPRGYTFRPPSHPLLQAVYFVVGGVVLIGLVLMGAFILAIALGLAIVVGIVIFARIWWQKLGGKRRPPVHPPAGGHELLEAEYEVIEEREDRDAHETQVR
jgi:hypothetical protein